MNISVFASSTLHLRQSRRTKDIRDRPVGTPDIHLAPVSTMRHSYAVLTHRAREGNSRLSGSIDSLNQARWWSTNYRVSWLQTLTCSRICTLVTRLEGSEHYVTSRSCGMSSLAWKCHNGKLTLCDQPQESWNWMCRSNCDIYFLAKVELLEHWGRCAVAPFSVGNL